MLERSLPKSTKLRFTLGSKEGGKRGSAVSLKDGTLGGKNTVD